MSTSSQLSVQNAPYPANRNTVSRKPFDKLVSAFLVYPKRLFAFDFSYFLLHWRAISKTYIFITQAFGYTIREFHALRFQVRYHDLSPSESYQKPRRKIIKKALVPIQVIFRASGVLYSSAPNMHQYCITFLTPKGLM